MRKIIGLGETVLDIIFKNHQVQKAVPGGSTFNAMISLGRARDRFQNIAKGSSEYKVLMATETGDDEVGTLITDFLRDNGVGTEYVYRHQGTQSHLSLAFLNERNDANYSFYKMHEALDMPMNIPEMAKGDIVLFGSFFAVNPRLRRYVSTFIDKAMKAGAIIYYDINFRAAHLKDLPQVMPFIEENIRCATIVRGSSEDFDILYHAKTAEEAYQRVNKQDGIFIYTDADKPIQAFTERVRVSLPVKAIETVSTIGAGDNFNAGFCYGLYEEHCDSPEQVSELTAAQLTRLIDYGQQFSSEVCQSLDNYISRK